MTHPLVVHVVYGLGVGGLENGVVNVVRAPASGLRHAVVSLTTVGAMADRLGPDVTVIALGKGAGHDLRAFGRLVGTLRRLRPAVVHSRNWAAFDAVLAARLAGVPRVVHGEHGRDIADPDGRHRRRNRLRRLLAPLVDRFVTVSNDLRRWLVEDVGIAARRVTTIVNGVDTERFGPGDRGLARAELALPPDRLLVGTVGRLDPVKDQGALIRAFAAIRQRHRDVQLVIAGDGPCRADLEALAAALGVGADVRMLGERADIPRVLGALDVFVLPSIAEGISNTILEAMATGLPIVATRVGGNPELVEDGGHGLLVPRQDLDALTRALDTYVDDAHLRALHGKVSRQRAVERFGLERMRAAYGDLYAGLLRRRDGRH